MPNDVLITWDANYNQHGWWLKGNWQHWTIKKKTKKVKLYGYINADGSLEYVTEDCIHNGWHRIIGKDKEVEVEE